MARQQLSRQMEDRVEEHRASSDLPTLTTQVERFFMIIQSDHIIINYCYYVLFAFIVVYIIIPYKGLLCTVMICFIAWLVPCMATGRLGHTPDRV